MKYNMKSGLIWIVSMFLLVCVSFASFGDEKRVLTSTWSWPTYIDPAVGSDYSSSTALCNLYDPFLMPTAEGAMEPWIATDWSASDDGLVYTFTIRQGVKFHDGTELDAEDIAFTMERLLTIGEGYAYLFRGKVAEVDVLDTYKVSFHLSETFGPLLYALSRLYIVNKDVVLDNIKPDGAYGDLGDYGKAFLLSHDAGSGPYMVQDFSSAEHLYADLFSEYWGYVAPGAPEEIKMIGTTEAITIRTMMGKRELDISDQWQTDEAFEALGRMEGINLLSFYDGSAMYLMMNHTKPPLDDVYVRRALSWAMDYEAVAQDAFPGSIQAIGPFPQLLPGHKGDVFQYHQDFDRAREELAKSKYAGQLDAYPIEYHWVSEVPDFEKLALLFQANCDEIGVNIEIVKTPWLKMIDQAALPESTPAIASIIVAPHYAEAGSMIETRYHSSNAGTWEQMEWLRDPEIDALIDDALATVDTEERFGKYHTLQEMLVEMVPSVFLIEKVEKHAYQSYISWPAGENPIPVMGYTFQFRLMEVDTEKKAALLGQ